jgi:hypothetical protein
MASEANEDKPARAGERPESRPEPERFVYGPRPLSALLPALVRPAFRGPSAATARIVADWAIIVGPAYAGLTAPRRFSGGTLTIACAGTVAMELQHVAPALIERINSHLGRVAVARLRFVQAAPPRSPPSAEAAPRPALQAARAAVAGLPPGELRDALERLGRAVLARHS